MVVFGKKWLYLGKNGCIRVKWLYSSKSDGIRTKKDAFGQSGCSRAKVVLFRQKLLYSDIVALFG